MADFNFQETLDSFTANTLSLLNSRDKIRNALKTDSTAPAGTRTDGPAQTNGGGNGLLLVLAGIVVYKVFAK